MKNILIDPSNERKIVDFRDMGFSDVLVLGRHSYLDAHEILANHTHGELLEVCYLDHGIQEYEVEGQSYLLMEYVTFRPATDDDWIKLGRNLARLHKTDSGSFGLDHDNFIGTLPQINTPMTKWTEFYAQRRIQPQIDMAVSLLSPVDLRNWEQLCAQLESILTDEPPSLIHGDLWSGNVQMSNHGPVIYDPAISYANREMDLAMSLLFGGFSHLFYDSYKAEFPVVNSGFDDRMQIYQLYYLLVHVNLFGVSYAPSVRGILKRFA